MNADQIDRAALMRLVAEHLRERLAGVRFLPTSRPYALRLRVNDPDEPRYFRVQITEERS